MLTLLIPRPLPSLIPPTSHYVCTALPPSLGPPSLAPSLWDHFWLSPSRSSSTEATGGWRQPTASCLRVSEMRDTTRLTTKAWNALPCRPTFSPLQNIIYIYILIHCIAHRPVAQQAKLPTRRPAACVCLKHLHISMSHEAYACCQEWQRRDTKRAYLAGDKRRPRAMPPRLGLRGWLEPADRARSTTVGSVGTTTLCSGAYPISRARMTKLVTELLGGRLVYSSKSGEFVTMYITLAAPGPPLQSPLAIILFSYYPGRVAAWPHLPSHCC